MSTALAVTRKGEGPQMIFLHGIGSSRTAWDRMITAFSGDFSCIAPDLPGYGDSPDPKGRTLADFAGVIADLCDGRPSHIVGVSFGALLAIALARQEPGLVRSLVLADATLGRGHMPEKERAAWLDARKALGASLATASVERGRQIAAPGADDETVGEIARHMRRARPEGYLAVAEAIAATDAGPWLSEIDMPTLVVFGEHDSVTGRAVSETIVARVAGARLERLAGAGHAPHVERPEAFGRCIRDFLSAQSA
ncbi:MAG: alpha/beta fold hydrolase [Rhodobacteraceae bacterium]|nr:alpha/beta fold hydrolase [Paracoccaceae bacterium]